MSRHYSVQNHIRALTIFPKSLSIVDRSVAMATEMNQSCVECSIGYLGNRSHSMNESACSCCTASTKKSPKWHQRLLRRESRDMSRSYISLDILEDCAYPFNVTETSLGSDLTRSDWSLSSSSNATMDSDTSSNATMDSDTNSNATLDSGIISINSHHLNRSSQSKTIARKLKSLKKPSKVVPL